MKNIWRVRLGLAATLAAAMCLAGCGGSPTTSSTTGPPATVAYTWGVSVGNGSPLTILEYSTASPTSNSPIGTLTLPPSCQGGPFTVDSLGQLYVACFIAAFDSQILIYPPSSTGTATPLRTIDIDNSYEITTLTVDPTGLLYVGTAGSGPAGVAVYAVGASGLVAPLRAIQFADNVNDVLFDVAADAAGNIYAARSPFFTNNPGGYIEVYSPEATGTSTPIRTITASSVVYGVAVDAAGNVLANACPQHGACAIERFAPDTIGAASPISTINLPDQPAGMVSVGGPIRLDGAGNAFASLDIYNPSTGNFTFSVYAVGLTAAESTALIAQMPEVDANNQREFAIN